MKRILIFSLAYHPWVGGAEVAIKELTDRLPDYKWEMITVNLNHSQVAQEVVGNIEVFRLPGGRLGKYLFPWRAVRWAARRHQAAPYDLVWAMMANQAGMAGAKFKKNFPQVPSLLTLQEGDNLDSLFYRLRLLGPRWFGVFKLTDQIQVISRYLETWARQMGATCPITVIPNGVDLEKFKTGSREQGTENSQDKIIITTSRLVKKNGVDTLIKALTFLPDNVKLQIVGSGEEESNLKQLVNRLKLAPRASFLGPIANSEVPGYLAQADIFCRPSRSEGLGISFLEAMAAGLPVIATPVGGIPDFLKHNQTGWLCQVDDPPSIADQVKFILDPQNSYQIKQVLDQANQLIARAYSWDGLATRLGQLFSQCLA